ncbi:LON peptidase substrate-binding domain-containing protein [Faunimonas pinastri]|uniref:LON peptidase substrate-binding domain-containing protein n=1 Tax=Faunimonas pinastri TaxID=1855383 RepID=UPI003D162568
MMAGNKRYEHPTDLPAEVPVFPLSGALLLPNGQMPLNVFEPRYVEMIDTVMAGERLIGMVQPRLGRAPAGGGGVAGELCEIGCLGRITQLAESGDGRYLVTLSGVTRFRLRGEVASGRPFRCFKVSTDGFRDLEEPREGEDKVNRPLLLATFRAYLDSEGLEADWESVDRASNAGLVTALSMMSPWGPADKQVLLEAPDHAARANALIAMTQFALAGGEEGAALQ